MFLPKAPPEVHQCVVAIVRYILDIFSYGILVINSKFCFIQIRSENFAMKRMLWLSPSMVRETLLFLQLKYIIWIYRIFFYFSSSFKKFLLSWCHFHPRICSVPVTRFAFCTNLRQRQCHSWQTFYEKTSPGFVCDRLWFSLLSWFIQRIWSRDFDIQERAHEWWEDETANDLRSSL